MWIYRVLVFIVLILVASFVHLPWGLGFTMLIVACVSFFCVAVPILLLINGLNLLRKITKKPLPVPEKLIPVKRMLGWLLIISVPTTAGAVGLMFVDFDNLIITLNALIDASLGY